MENNKPLLPDHLKTLNYLKKVGFPANKILLRRSNILKIEYGLILTRNRGLDFWINRDQPSRHNINIVTEIFLKNE